MNLHELSVKIAEEICSNCKAHSYAICEDCEISGINVVAIAETSMREWLKHHEENGYDELLRFLVEICGEDNDKLNPCQKCGAEAVICEVKRTGYIAKCKKCGKQTHVYITLDDEQTGQEKAAKAWNAREFYNNRRNKKEKS